MQKTPQDRLTQEEGAAGIQALQQKRDLRHSGWQKLFKLGHLETSFLRSGKEGAYSTERRKHRKGWSYLGLKQQDHGKKNFKRLKPRKRSTTPIKEGKRAQVER